MVRDVENYTKMREPEFREVNLKKLIELAVGEWRQEMISPDIQVNLDIADEETTFPGDEDLLSLALKNLLQNAGDAMTDPGEVSISAHPQGRQIFIKVADTGRGISPEDIPQIFDPFFTSKTQGSGLGLTTVQRIVIEHNGEISVKSTPGQGAEFQILLPLYPDDMQLNEFEVRGNKE